MCVWFLWIRSVKQFFLQEEPTLFFTECAFSRCLSFSSSSVCCQDPGRWQVDGATDCFAKEPDHWKKSLEKATVPGSIKDKEPNLKVLCSFKFCEAMGQRELCCGGKATKLQGAP